VSGFDEDLIVQTASGVVLPSHRDTRTNPGRTGQGVAA
jgi:hypothetical protein